MLGDEDAETGEGRRRVDQEGSREVGGIEPEVKCFSVEYAHYRLRKYNLLSVSVNGQSVEDAHYGTGRLSQTRA
jgi:hypothetical protein